MNKEILFQRDEFIKEIYKFASKNKKIYFLSADFGAPALDNFRLKLKSQFLLYFSFWNFLLIFFLLLFDLFPL